MNILSNKLKIKAILGVSALLISGCTTVQPTPVEQVQQANNVAQTQLEKNKVSIAKKQMAVRFQCKNDKTVRVTYPKKTDSKNVKNNRVVVVFNDVSHTLTPAVTKNGKKYTNIRWTWWEPRNGKAYLIENPQRVLAENCVEERV